MTVETRHSDHLKYRPDIDGLRAIAVLAVVLFHAGVKALPGGYVGVDVFFVISGFLITTILLDDNSIRRFYLRRARRILPALFAMSIVVLAAGMVLLLPADLDKAAGSIAATLAFVSNIFFWRESGYFQPNTAIMPSLHTWSLGVEEQFYIVFPWIVILASRLTRRANAILFAGLALLSLAVAIVGMRIGQANAVFYLSPVRAWELLAGAILATGIVPPIGKAWMRATLGLLGLALLLWPILLYSPETSFPGLAALPPVLGSAFIIAAGNGGRHPVGALLSVKPMVAVGLISYSLYLWHWPILALARYRLVRDITPIEGVAAVALAILLAALSWRFVERPFRRRLGNRAVIAFSILGAGAIFAVCGAIVALHGLPQRFPSRVLALDADTDATWKCPIVDNIRFGPTLACPLNLPSRKAADADIILWGDSHAQMYAPALAAIGGQRTSMLLNVYGCAPVVAGDNCGGRQQRAAQAVIASPAKIVILAQNWPEYRVELGARYGREPRPEEEYLPAIERLTHTVAALRAAGKQVIIVAPVPRPDYDVVSILSREMAFDGRPLHPVAIDEAELDRQFANVDQALAGLAKQRGVVVLDLTPQLCPLGNCGFVRDDHAVFADYGHLTTWFARTLAPQFAGAIDRTTNRQAAPKS